MNAERDAMAKANKKVHRVQDQWHYPIFTKAGFVPENEEAIGFVRSYIYKHSSGRRIEAITGVNSDRWSDLTDGKSGYWDTLQAHLQEVMA